MPWGGAECQNIVSLSSFFFFRQMHFNFTVLQQLLLNLVMLSFLLAFFLLLFVVLAYSLLLCINLSVDRSHGKEFCKQFEDSCMKIEDYVNTLEREIIQRKAVLAMCENSEIFYDEQFKEAKIVANVSMKFLSVEQIRWLCVVIIFFSSPEKKTCCGYSLELAWRGDSNEYP